MSMLGLGKLLLFIFVLFFLATIVGFSNIPIIGWIILGIFGIFFLSKGRI